MNDFQTSNPPFPAPTRPAADGQRCPVCHDEGTVWLPTADGGYQLRPGCLTCTKEG